VVLGELAVHPVWGVVALPLLAQLYVRKKDLIGIHPKHRPPFRTKLELAVELLRWAAIWLKLLGKPDHGDSRLSDRHPPHSGIPEAVVREWVGHVDRDVLRLYTHIASTESRAAMRRFVGQSEGKAANEEGKTGNGDAPKTDS
jgi:hypothetical protein